jgi:putative peptide zinc metalloprotease protein
MTEPLDVTQPITERQEPAPAGATQPLPPADGAAPTTAGGAPRLAEGVELIGRMEGSGYKEPPFMARRADGQMIQLAPILYLVAERADGNHTHDQIAEEVSQIIERGLDGDGVRMLVEEKLRPLGILAGADGASAQVEKQDQFLALKLKTALIPPGVVRGITAIFKPLFWPPVILAVLAGFVAFDAWFFFDHGAAESLRQLLYQPLYLIMTFAAIVFAAAFHESGHATGCRYGGAEPGAMGAGIYIVWPAFYTDVTDSYRLGRGGRLRTDLGGVYFNAVFILAMAGAYFATGFEPLLIPVLLAHLEIFRQLLPLLRLDGYYVLSDLVGVPDLFARIKPILVSFIPWKRADASVKELKWWVRWVVRLWVIVFIAFLAINLAYIVLFAPRILATGWDSFQTHYGQTAEAFGSGNRMAGAAGVIKLIALGLPALGIAFGLTRGGTKLTRGAWSGTRGKPIARLASLLMIVGLVAGVGVAWWPDGDYVPIQQGERWTLQSASTVASETAGGRPAFDDVPVTRPENDDQEPTTDDPTDTTELLPVGQDPLTTPSPSPSATLSPSPSPSLTTSPSPESTTEPTPTSSPSPPPSPTPTITTRG